VGNELILEGTEVGIMGRTAVARPAQGSGSGSAGPGQRGESACGASVHFAADANVSPVTESADLSFGTRLWFAWACFFRVLFDGAFARRAFEVREPAVVPPRLVSGKRRVSTLDDEDALESDRPRASMEGPRVARMTEQRALAKTVREPSVAKPADPVDVAATREVGALSLLALLQREGRFVDFVQQDMASFGDDEIGAAARVVQAGCRKALGEHAKIEPVREESEGARVEVPVGYDPSSVKLVGNVKGDPPFEGALVHRGWRAGKLALPEPVTGHDVHVLAPAEVEL
jgi:hypothetical protein